MKSTSLIFTLLVTINASAAIHLDCHGTVDKSVKITAVLDENGGQIKAKYKRGYRMVQTNEKLELKRTTNLENRNFVWATKNRFDKDQLSLYVRGHLILSQFQGTTEDIGLFLSPAYLHTAEWAYGVSCKIQQD